jgi:hypothetical protein
LDYISIGSNLKNRKLIAQQLGERINKWYCIKLKSFLTTKETVTRLKRLPTEWERENLCQLYICQGINSQSTEELKKPILQRINDPLDKWTLKLNRHFSKELQVTNKYMKK